MVEQLLQQRYEILQVLSQAALTQQLLAADHQQPERPECRIYTFALQTEHPDVLDCARQLFAYEVERFTHLSQHPTIPALSDAFEIDGVFYVVQPWLDGQTLAQIVQVSSQPTDQLVVGLVRSLAETLDAIHAHQTLHCNLSPHNILWHDPSRAWLVLDFGAFHQISALNIDEQGEVQLQGRLGAPGYIPTDPATPLDPKYDFYSLGMIAIEALWGQLPAEPQQWRSHLPSMVHPGITKCLDRLLTGTYTRATDIVTDLETTIPTLPGTTVVTPSPGSATPPRDAAPADVLPSSPTEDLQPNTFLASRYRLLRPLSKGGFGETYLAIDEQFPGQPQCVVKKLKPRNPEPRIQKIARELFEREAEVLSRLGAHPQLPQLMAHFEENGEFYLVEEFINGHDLDSELPLKAQLSEPHVVRLLTDILEVLSFVHDQKVIHRDIKPANIRRRKPDNKLVLIDFGAVKQLNEVTIAAAGEEKFTVSIGTAGFAPSEQTQGRPRLSSDIYAVGMIGIQALTGVDPEELPEDPKTGEVVWQPLVTASPELSAVLSRMVRYDFRQRYPSARLALQALTHLYDGPQLSDSGRPIAAKSQPWFKRYSRSLGMASSVLLTTGLGTSAYQLGWFNPSPQQLANRVTKSTVQVQHNDGKGFSTGFVIAGTSFQCTVLTTRAAIASGQEVTIQLSDGTQNTVEDSQTFAGLDVVKLTLPSDTADCPYPALPLGDSTRLVQDETVYVGGYVRPEGTAVTEQNLRATTLEQVLEVPLTGGYRLAYATESVQSLPGSVVLNRHGRVVGIHGQIVKPDGDISEGLDVVEEELGWAIPLRTYLVATQATGDAPDTAQQIQDEADLFFAARRYEDALAAYERLSTLRHDRPAPWYGKGSSLYNLNRYEEAIAAYDKALDFRLENALIWYSRANAYFQLEDYLNAKASYEQAVKYKPDYFTAWNNLGLAQQAMEDYEAAIASFETAIEFRPKYHTAWNNKGTTLALQGKWQQAIAAYQEAIKLRPAFSQAWYNLAVAHSQQGSLDEALTSLKEAIALRKNWAEIAQSDQNLQPLRTKPAFQALVKQ